MKSPLGHMSHEMFHSIIDQMAEYPGTALVPFFRGESMLHPEFIQYIHYAKVEKRVAPIQFTTNASYLDRRIARELVDMGLDFISFSIDSIDPGIYDRLRAPARLDDTLAKVEYICDYRRSSGKRRPVIQVSVVRTADTSDGVDLFVDYWRERVDRVRVYPQHSADGNFGSLDGAPRFEERLPCHKPFTDLVIYWDGRVALCNHDWDRPEEIGDVTTETIGQIWTGRAYERIRNAHLQDVDHLDPVCRKCDHWQGYYREGNLAGELYEQDCKTE